MAMEWLDPHDFSRHLRRAMTPAEFLLWQLVRNRQRRGFKFRRQYVKGPYLLDFYCSEAKLCIECDGLPHFTTEGIDHDKRRTQFLNEHRIEVIRFTSQEIEQDTQRVLAEIDMVLDKRYPSPHPPTPSPPEEEKGS